MCVLVCFFCPAEMTQQSLCFYDTKTSVFLEKSHISTAAWISEHIWAWSSQIYTCSHRAQGDSPKLQTQFNLLKKSNRNLCTYYGLCYYCKITTQFFRLKSSVFWLTVHLLYVLSFPANAFDRVTGWMQDLDIFLESEKARIKYIFVYTYLYALLQRKYISLYITLLIIHRIICCVNI